MDKCTSGKTKPNHFKTKPQKLNFYCFVCSEVPVLKTHLLLQQSGLELKWVDGGKPLFTLSTHLVSTVYTQVNTHGGYYNYQVRQLLSHCRVLWIKTGLLNYRMFPPGSTFTQLLQPLPKHGGVRTSFRGRAGQISEGIASRLKQLSGSKGLFQIVVLSIVNYLHAY